MNRPERYKKTVDVLFAAYFNDTLEHGTPCGCAVGNMILANMPKLKRTHCWGNHWFFYMRPENRIGNDPFVNISEAKMQIKVTGYSIEELSMIEHAFERADFGNSNEDWMFNGLVAVLDALKKIHEVEDNETDVQRFRNHYQTLTV